MEIPLSRLPVNASHITLFNKVGTLLKEIAIEYKTNMLYLVKREKYSHSL